MRDENANVSAETSRRWVLMSLLILIGVGVLASSVYFLIFPAGYQGGRNPNFGHIWLFTRSTWEALHLWMGLVMILVLTIHIIVHWSWIKMMAIRYIKSLFGRGCRLNGRAQYNVMLDVVTGLSFILASLSGVYLLFAPSRSAAASAPVILFNWYGCDIIHTWSGIVMFISVFLHFYIHWGWIINVSRKKLGMKKLNTKLELDGARNA